MGDLDHSRTGSAPCLAVAPRMAFENVGRADEAEEVIQPNAVSPWRSPWRTAFVAVGHRR